MPGVPGVDGAAHVAVPARAPGVRAVPRAPRLVPRVPDHVLVRAEPRHGGRGRARALPVPPRLRPRGAPAPPRAARGVVRLQALPLPGAALCRRGAAAARQPRRSLPGNVDWCATCADTDLRNYWYDLIKMPLESYTVPE